MIANTEYKGVRIFKKPEFGFVVIWLVITAMLLFYLFLQQARGIFTSDLSSHIQTAINGEGYSVISRLLSISYRIAGNYGCAALLTVVSIGTIILSGWMFRFFLQESHFTERISIEKSILLAGPLCFLGGIYIPLIYPIFYLTPNYSGVGSAGSLCTQPWHNSTYLLMRLFAILAVVFFFRLYQNYKHRVKISDYIKFTLALALANAAKPNFFIAFAPAALVFLIVDFIKQKGKGFLRMLGIGICVLISMPILFIQANMLFDDSAEKDAHGVAFTLIVVKKLINEGTIIPLLLTGLAFVLIATFVIVKKGHTNKRLLFGWTMLGFAFFESLFIVETGPRAAAGNFGWGVPCCMFILVSICFSQIYIIKNRINKKLYYLTITPLCLMLVTGFVYFILLLDGKSFMI